MGQTPHAIVTLRAGATATEQELIDHVRAHLASYKKPTRVLFVDEIVRTAAGKADRRWATEHAVKAAQAAAGVTGGSDDVLRREGGVRPTSWPGPRVWAK